MAGRLSVSLEGSVDVIGYQFNEHLSKVFVNDDPALCPHLGITRASVLMNVLKDGKTEPDGLFVPLGGGWRSARLNRAKHVMDTTDKQLVLIMEMHVEGRSADIGAIEDFLHGNTIIGLLANEEGKSLMQEALRLLNPPIFEQFFLQHRVFR
jgi:hypothetical protein